MALLIHADECVDSRIVGGLRQQSVDVLTAKDLGLLSATDEEHLASATEKGRVLLTADDDFLALTKVRLASGEHFVGLIYIRPNAPIGATIRAIVDLTKTLTPKQMLNWIEWVP